tara:strand:+ start:2567 stop:2785 length:219 start_codon:yes stop_codon:yes gene_type:complete
MAQEPHKDEEDEAYIFYWFVPILIIIILSIKFLPDFFSNRTAKKVKCRADITVTEAKTDFVAKNAYKICMKK